ncbi:MAG: ATP-binding protein, partial [Oscillospiraceae bacterium]|nr:ATP-binding protein [Oscillospiraceae bacterium]
KKYVRDVKTSTDALLSIINDILDLFKLSSGKMPLVPHDYDFLQFIDVLSAYAGKGSEKKSLEYRFETIGKPPLSLYGDEKRLMKVLKNIISNAVKYTKKGFISFKIIINEDDITFEIRDSGKGIKPDSIESLFNVFEQEENVTGINEHADKTGLDLPIAKKLIALMDGKLNVVSEYGVGSVFTVSIPKIIGDINKLTLKPAKTDLFFAENTRILIVDDNEMNLEVAKGLITSLYGIQCDTALSGTEAVLCAKKNVYDLVFMDHIMPEMSGTETAHRIRDAGGSNRSLPIIALTVNTVIGIKDLLIKEGMNDFLAKPIIIDEMTDILRKWLPKEKRIQKTVMTDEHDFVKEENRVIKAAEMIAALDVKSGLTNVAGKEKVYEKSLKLLSEKIPKMITTMEDALNDNNIGDFTIHVHGLKSSLAVVGANSLSKTAFTLEKAGKEKNMDFCKETLPDFVRQLHDLKKKISAVFDSEAPESDNASGKPKGEREKAVAFLEALKEAAGNYDFETLTGTITQMSEFDFGSKMNSDVVKLKNLSELFNYSGIQTVIDELKTEIQNNPAFFE